MSIKLGKKQKLNRRLVINKKISISFIFISVLLFFLLVINLSDIFSSVITNKNSLFFVQKIELPSYSVYAVSLNDFNNFDDANDCSILVQKQGGAGVVYESGEKFVFVSAYPTLIEAKEIQQNLIELGYKSRIVNIKIDAISKEYKGSKYDDILSSINYFRSCFLKVYESTIKFDKGENTKNQVNSVLAKLLAQISTIQNKLSLFKQSEDLTLKELISVPLKQIKSSLKDAIYYAENDLIYTSKLKQIYISFAICNKELINKINALN